MRDVDVDAQHDGRLIARQADFSGGCVAGVAVLLVVAVVRAVTAVSRPSRYVVTS